MEFAEIDKSTGFITIYIETNKAVSVIITSDFREIEISYCV